MNRSRSHIPKRGGGQALAVLRAPFRLALTPLLAIAMLALAVVGAIQVASESPASTANVPNAITNIQIRETSTGLYDIFNIDLNWSVPDSASSGDTFYFDLPTQINDAIPPFQLRSPDNQVVANAVVSNGRVTFTLTDYADRFSAVSGTAFFQSTWNRNQVAGGSTVNVAFTTSTQTFTDSVAVGTAPGIDRSKPRKFGRWNDPADQGVTAPAGALIWGVESAVGPSNSVRFQDSPSAGHLMDCLSVEVLVIDNFDASGDARRTTPADPSTYTITCTPTSLDVTVTPVVAGKAVRVRYSTTVTNNTAATYNNRAVITQDGVAYNRASTTRRTVGGGTGGGEIPSIGIEKFTTALGFPAGDFDTAPGQTVDANAATPVSMVITNTGTDPLVSLTVSDTTNSGPALTDLSCDFSPLGGPSTGVTWVGPFASQASFTCTGTLPAMGPDASHSNTAAVVGTGSVTGTEVNDNDPWNAITEPATPTPKVSVGDYVFVDTNRDGIQDAGDVGISNVRLTITGPGGAAVRDVFGNSVTETFTNGDGLYSFDDLPTLPAGQSYTVTIDGTSPSLAPYVPTITGQGTSATDSSTGSATSGELVNDGDRDPTLDFGFVTPSVSVGDYVFVDTNRDGIQDAGDIGIPNVRLTITGPGGAAVVDVFDNPVAETFTDANGNYSFDNLPTLPAGQSYTVTIDGTSPALAPYVPTITGQGTLATDSSTGSATSGDLTNDGDRDPSLDFGFVTPETPVTPEPPVVPEPPVTPGNPGTPSNPGNGQIPTGVDNNNQNAGTPTTPADASPSQQSASPSNRRGALPRTGSDVLQMVMIGLALVGSGYTLTRRRKSVSTTTGV